MRHCLLKGVFSRYYQLGMDMQIKKITHSKQIVKIQSTCTYLTIPFINI